MSETKKASEHERDNLYCAMLHLACFVEDAKKERIGSRANACQICKIREQINCSFNFYDRVKDLSESVGIAIVPFINEKADYQVHCGKSDSC